MDAPPPSMLGVECWMFHSYSPLDNPATRITLPAMNGTSPQNAAASQTGSGSFNTFSVYPSLDQS